MLRSEGLEDLHAFLLDTSETLQIMEHYGVAVDMEYLEQLEHEYGTILAHLEDELSPWVKNPRSWQQVKKALMEMGVRRVPSTDREHLEEYRDRAMKKVAKQPKWQEVVNFCNLLLEYRTEQKRYGTYVKGTRKRVYESRVYPTFLIHGTVSGRLSSRNPNIQNVPRLPRIRRLFVPTSSDNMLIQADYGQAELRVVCGLARDAYLREVFSDPERDIHGEVATRFYGPNWTKEQRVRAKAVVFGLTYGREAFSLAAEHGMTVAEARYYIETFFEVIPDTVKWIKEEVEEKVLRGEDLITPFGRHRRFWLISDGNKKNILKEARSFLPQSTASDLTLKSANRLRNLGYGEFLRFPVHDALVAEAPTGVVEEVAAAMKEVMEETGDWLFDGYIPFPVEVKIGQNWGELE
jgi:DNA polymerase-1